LRELSETVQMRKQDIHIGLSAFNNSYWKGIFYPEDLPRSKWFEYYTKHFKTYELNGTFYRKPTIKSLQNWHDKVPGDFLFSVKAPKTITHLKKFIDCDDDIAEFYTVCREGLKEKLAYVLFQLPPSFDYSPERLQIIVQHMNPDFKNIIEFRNKSWWNNEVYATFVKNNLVFCSVSYPKLPEDILSQSCSAYVRLHGRPKLFYSDYSTEELCALTNVLMSNDDCREVFIYFNNTASESGIVNALKLKELIASAKEAPLEIK